MALLAVAVIFASCSRSNGSITMGSKSQFDSLSYALGNNVGAGLNRMMSDIPFDFDAMTEGVTEGALGTAKMTHPEALDTLRTFFMVTRPERAQAIAKKNAMTPDSLKTPEESLADPAMFESEEERRFISYAFGIDLGNNMLGADLPIQLVWFGQGLKDITGNGEEARMTEQEAVKFLRNWYSVVRPAENKKANEEWIASIEKKSGVQKTESGLLYKIEKKGDETLMPTDSRDRVKVYYTGTNYKGQVFDSSYFENKPEEMKEYLKQIDPEGYDKDEAVEFELGQVIPGWTEGLKLIGKGGKITLWIPAELAYGRQARGKYILPNSALKFEVELEDVIPFVEETTPATTDEAAAATTQAANSALPVKK